MSYKASGNKVVIEDNYGETMIRATCEQAEKAVEMLNRASYLNDVKRQYTAAARLIAKVEDLPGFAWND